MLHDYHDLIRLFADCFYDRYNTRLVKGAEEPLYIPAHAGCDYHAIVFAHGFFSSALHECAHWLLAGKARRLQMDYGYWYVPDGRTLAQQQEFEQVEVKPQALECILSQACGYPFQFSYDNLNGEIADNDAFIARVQQQVSVYQAHGLSARAARFYRVLQSFYQE